MKTTSTLEEADLYAALLLTLLATVKGNRSEYAVHLKGFEAIMRELKQKAATTGYSLTQTVFWPLARDLILEGGRNVSNANNLEVSFLLACQDLIGYQNIVSRYQYLTTFYGEEFGRENAFLQSTWQYCRILRVCFRETVYEQLEGAQEVSQRTKSLVSEIKSDLSSPEIEKIVNQLHGDERDVLSADTEIHARTDVLRYARLVYQYCRHLVLLLDGNTVLEAVVSREARTSAMRLTEFIRPEWLNPLDSAHYIFPRPTAPCLLPRILWTAGLSLTIDRAMIGKGFLTRQV